MVSLARIGTKQYPFRLARVQRLFEYFVQVIDEVSAAEVANSANLVFAGRFKKNIAPAQTKTIFVEESISLHPEHCLATKRDTILIEMSVFRLVTDDKYPMSPEFA